MFTLNQIRSLSAKLKYKFESVKNAVDYSFYSTEGEENGFVLVFKSKLESSPRYNRDIFWAANLSRFKTGTDKESLFLCSSSCEPQILSETLKSIATDNAVFVLGLTASKKLMTDKEFEKKFGPLCNKEELGQVDHNLSIVLESLEIEELRHAEYGVEAFPASDRARLDMGGGFRPIKSSPLATAPVRYAGGRDC
jgi:hypothetical protein